jgi:pSer/pThr/pTyr-binding forkhead associated (FHA) protein
MVHYYLTVATAIIVLMPYPNSNPIPSSDKQISPGFNTQSPMGLPEILQMCCLSRRSGQITFRSGESYGFIFIQHGRVLHAMCGPVEGEEAIYTMLTWPAGSFTVNEDILPHKKTVTLTWEQLLLEGARRADADMTSPKASTGVPITTREPVGSIRTQESQPKLTIVRPDLPPVFHELTHEYTHVGRAAGNEICLHYPSISSRHCIFIMSGPDIVLRDLNSSNGTMVNDEAINEIILRPGDLIQVGVVQMKFEAGIKRPKLLSPVHGTTQLPDPLNADSSSPLTHDTIRLPSTQKRQAPDQEVKDDQSFMKGQSAISYDNLAKPEIPKPKSPWPTLIISIVILLVAGGAFYYFFILR